MTREQLFKYCLDTYGTSPDYPFEEDSVTAVLRHDDTRKWYALAMNIPRSRLIPSGDGRCDVVNLKLPPEMFGSFGAEDGVYPAYHMSKLHWISVILSDAEDDLVKLLVGASFASTAKSKRKKMKPQGAPLFRLFQKHKSR